MQALDDVAFSVKAGSVHVLCGENGAGKSTLMKIINGIYQPDSGETFIRGEKVEIKSPIKAGELGISMIFQELNYMPEMSIEESLFVGRWPKKSFRPYRLEDDPRNNAPTTQAGKASFRPGNKAERAVDIQSPNVGNPKSDFQRRRYYYHGRANLLHHQQRD